MDFVARAKALVKRQGRAAALVIVPLAAAVSAQGAPILPTGNFGCTVIQGSNVNCGGATQLPNNGNGLQGVKFFTNSSIIFNDAFSGGQVGQLLMQVSGTQNEAFNGAMPLAYNFTLTGAVSTWSLGFSVSQTGGASSFAAVNGSGTGLQTGTAAFPGAVALQAGLNTNVNYLLTINYTGSGVSVNVPQSSIDFNALPTGVPEPSAAMLVGLGLTLAGGWRLLQRRKQLLLVRSQE